MKPHTARDVERGRHRRRTVTALLGTAVAAVLAVAGFATPASATPSTVTPAANPALPDRCELDFAISVDLSNSITSTQLSQVKEQLGELATALEGAPVRLALYNFASNAPATGGASNAPLALTSMADAAGVELFTDRVDGLQRPSERLGGTNWDRGLAAVQASAEAYDALLFVTDGNPTQYGQPAQGPGSSTDVPTISAAVTSANAVKAEGTRIVPIGVSDNVTGGQLTEFRQNMSQISGPTEGSDYFVSGFSSITESIMATVQKNCAGIDLVKEAELADGSTGVPGDLVEYTFDVTNTGKLTLFDVEVTDPKPNLSTITYGAWPGEPGVLKPGESVTATATYPLTADDVLAGTVHNEATATGTPRGGHPVTDTDPADVTLPALHPAIDLVKDGVLADGARGVPGDVVEYTFTATNTGDVTLTGVAITDPKEGLSALAYGAWPGAEGVLAPGQSITATATYTLTAADVTAGRIDNTATATGTPPAGPAVTDEDPAEVVLTPLAPAIDLVKDGVLSDGARGLPGDVVEYTFTATNTGDVTLTGVAITDPKEGLSALAYSAWPGAEGVLAPGQSITATATYTLTAADVTAGRVDNTATTTGTPPVGPAVTDEDPAEVVLTPLAPAIDLVKDGDLADGAQGVPGDVVEYTFIATNTGDVTLTGVTITDPKTGLSAIAYGEWPGDEGVLAPGQSVTATATYTLTVEDVVAGTVDNLATATGTPPVGDEVSDEDPATVVLPELHPAIGLEKTAALAAGAVGAPGDLVEYTFTATNLGDVTLTGVTIADPKPGLSALAYGEWPGDEGVLAPGQSVTATATYALTVADVEAGAVTNTATTTGTAPDGREVTDDDSEDLPLPQLEPAIGIRKSGALAAGAQGLPGDLVEYEFLVTNTGNVTLTGVTIADPLPGLSDIAFGEWPAEAGVLQPGESVTATATAPLTVAQVEAGSVQNTATATGTPPVGEPVTDDDTADVPLPVLSPRVDLEKTGALAEGSKGLPGDVITYTFVATNTGDVTLTGVVIADPKPGLSEIAYGEWPGEAGVLKPGESVTATATYAVTAEDRSASRVDNLATVTGTPPVGPAVTDDAPASVVLPEISPAVSLVKDAKLDGDVVRYTFTVTNTGDVRLTGVVIADPLPGLSAIEYGEWPGEPGVLEAGQTVTATATYTLTDADRAAGAVSKRAIVTGQPPVGPPVTAEASAKVTVPAKPDGLIPTGAENLASLVGGAALVVALLGGGVLWFAMRRRRA